jgi:uncharacterized protein (DUF362 family)
MSRVVVRPSTYRYEDLKNRFFEIMDALDGGRLIEPGRPVLIKPNLLSSAKPEQAVLTHPLIVRAAAEFVLQKGGRPRIGDSPAVGSFKRVIRESGIAAALADLDVEFCEFTRSVKADVGEPFGVIDLAAEALEAPLIINLPKLKTHSQMGLTLGVKNLFGCVVGLRKAQWHLRAGIDRDLFARLLVQIHQRIRPAFTMIDGILAMEGDGPGRRGIPRELGLLLGSRDAFAADHTVCQILGQNPEKLPILRVPCLPSPASECLSSRLSPTDRTAFRVSSAGISSSGRSVMPLCACTVRNAGRCARRAPSPQWRGPSTSITTAASAAIAASKFVPREPCTRRNR